MTPEELTAITDTIKIGFPILGTLLGAIVGGVSTYFINKQTQKSQYNKETMKDKRALLIQASDDLVELENAATTYSLYILNTKATSKNINASEDAKLLEHLKKSSDKMSRARGLLRVLGVIEADSLIEKYLVLIRKVCNESDELTYAQVEELYNQIEVGDSKLFSLISKYYDGS